MVPFPDSKGYSHLPPSPAHSADFHGKSQGNRNVPGEQEYSLRPKASHWDSSLGLLSIRPLLSQYSLVQNSSPDYLQVLEDAKVRQAVWPC